MRSAYSALKFEWTTLMGAAGAVTLVLALDAGLQGILVTGTALVLLTAAVGRVNRGTMLRMIPVKAQTDLKTLGDTR